MTLTSTQDLKSKAFRENEEVMMPYWLSRNNTQASIASKYLFIFCLWLNSYSISDGIIDTTEGGKANFKGCIRDVTIGAQTKDWADMESLHNVLMDSCPISQ